MQVPALHVDVGLGPVLVEAGGSHIARDDVVPDQLGDVEEDGGGRWDEPDLLPVQESLIGGDKQCNVRV